MRKLIIPLIASLLLFQSCYTYRKVNNSKFEVGKMYSIKLNNKRLKIKLNQVTDSTIVVIYKNKEKIISKSEIQEVKKRKFSVIKTITLPVGAIAGMIALFVITDPKIGKGASISSPN